MKTALLTPGFCLFWTFNLQICKTIKCVILTTKSVVVCYSSNMIVIHEGYLRYSLWQTLLLGYLIMAIPTPPRPHSLSSSWCSYSQLSLYSRMTMRPRVLRKSQLGRDSLSLIKVDKFSMSSLSLPRPPP